MLSMGSYNPIPATQFVGPLLESGAQRNNRRRHDGRPSRSNFFFTYDARKCGRRLPWRQGRHRCRERALGRRTVRSEEISRQVKTVVGAIIGTIAGIFTFGLGAIPALLGSFAGSAASSAAAANSNGSGLNFNINDKHFRGLGTGSQWGLGIMGAAHLSRKHFGLGENLIGRFAGKGWSSTNFPEPLALGAILGEVGRAVVEVALQGTDRRNPSASSWRICA